MYNINRRLNGRHDSRDFDPSSQRVFFDIVPLTARTLTKSPKMSQSLNQSCDLGLNRNSTSQSPNRILTMKTI